MASRRAWKAAAAARRGGLVTLLKAQGKTTT